MSLPEGRYLRSLPVPTASRSVFPHGQNHVPVGADNQADRQGGEDTRQSTSQIIANAKVQQLGSVLICCHACALTEGTSFNVPSQDKDTIQKYKEATSPARDLVGHHEEGNHDNGTETHRKIEPQDLRAHRDRIDQSDNPGIKQEKGQDRADDIPKTDFRPAM